MIVVPDQFAEQLVDYERPRVATCSRSVPALAEEFAQRWRLIPALGDRADDEYRAVRDIAPWALG
ncbi:hypothetical protein [Nocardia brasiliensis]|uniref:hypothetical protein n=1 Tax=Nocardia brasiliensis TaxID=37326 RepID=UPI002453A898|nr:hypothetical protein [Nocardia brasiliensis]